MPSPYYPHPRDFICIRENETAFGPLTFPGDGSYGGYKVPVGKMFIPTCIGCNTFNIAGVVETYPVSLAAIFFPGMPDYQSGSGNNGRELICGLSGPPSNEFTGFGKFASNLCTFVALPVGLVYREGTEVIIAGGGVPNSTDPVIDPPEECDARVYGFVIDA